MSEKSAQDSIKQIPDPGQPEISLKNLTDNQPIANGLVVEGEVKGNWFFEASFPVEIYDANDQKLATVLAGTKENWMTSENISFFVRLEFPKPATERGYVVFKRDNPSGLPVHDREFKVQVRFSGNNESSSSGGCVIAGCSGQLCMEASEAENQGITTCEMQPEYACFQQFGKCVRLTNGLCGWQPTEELNNCLENN